MFEGFVRHHIKIDDVSIHCVVAGNGPPLLLLHGFPQNLAMWSRVAPRLTENFTVVCADLRGYGDSSKPRCLPDNSNYSFRTMANDYVQLMNTLGFESFHLAGHDRGGRAAHRLGMDFPASLKSLTVMDIVPTYTVFTETNRYVAGAYWHWYFLSQPEPFPEHMIALDPDFFYETCLFGWGATSIDDFDREQLADYRRCWRNPEMIHGSCADYRAAATIDLEHDKASLQQKIDCPALVLYGSKGIMAQCYDIPTTWQSRLANMEVATLPGGHFFVDVFPEETADILASFIKSHSPD